MEHYELILIEKNQVHLIMITSYLISFSEMDMDTLELR